MNDVLTVLDRNPLIEGEHLLLRKITKQDAEDMYLYSRDPAVSRYLLWSPHPSLNYTKCYLDEILRRYRDHSFHDFAVVCKEDGRMIGTCGFTRMVPEHGFCEIGYVLSSSYWNRHFGREAVSLILRYAFCHLGFHRVEARYMIGNDASRVVMENNGMTFEGIEREAVYAKGVYHDVGKCAILRSDFVQKFGGMPLERYTEKKTHSFPFF